MNKSGEGEGSFPTMRSNKGLLPALVECGGQAMLLHLTTERAITMSRNDEKRVPESAVILLACH